MPARRQLIALPLLAIVALSALLVLGAPGRAHGIGFGVALVVDTTADTEAADGHCSLREAIIATNNNTNDFECHASGSAGPDGIFFDIGAGTPVINITAPLPIVTGALSIDGAGPATRVELRGPGSITPVSGHHGLNITAANVTISNMVIDNFEDDGIKDAGANLVLKGDFIGTDATGTSASPNAGFGVQLAAAGAQIGGATTGGPCSGDCNLISGNDKDGILIDSGSTGAIVKGNFIGMDAAGTGPLGNDLYGIEVKATGATIGGSSGTTPGGACTGDCNLIAANDTAGTVDPNVEFESTATGGLVVGNFVGLNVTGTAHLSNGQDLQQGIEDYGSDLTIGGTGPTLRNVISGESAGEIIVYGNDAKIKGNYVGLNSAGTAAIPMSGTGMYVFNVTGTIIGGATPSEGNVISGSAALGGLGIELNSVTGAAVEHNLVGTAADGITPVPNELVGISVQGNSHDDIIGGADPNTIMFNGIGVTVDGIPTPDKITITGNSIDDNNGKGIELGNGGNDNQAAPVVESVQNDTNTTTHVIVSLTSAPNTDYQVDLYDSPVCDPSGYGEGRTHGATATVHTDGSGVGHLDTEEAQLGAVGTGVAATATDPNGNTSEFSNCLAIQGQATPTPSPTPIPTPTPTGGATPTPTGTPSENRIEGDVNCDGSVNEADSEFLLQFAADLIDGTTPGTCPDVGVHESITGYEWGDVNCDGSVNALDALYVLVFMVQLHTLPSPLHSCIRIGFVIT